MKKNLFLLLSILALGLWSFGAFTFPVNVSNSSVSSQWPAVCFGTDGMVHMVWVVTYSATSSDVMYVNYDGVTWSTPVKITATPDHGRTFPFIACNDKGTLAVVWEQSGGETWINVFDYVKRTWGTEEMVDEAWTGYLNKPKVALDPYGNIYCFYFTRGLGYAYTKCKINGVWEARFRVNLNRLRTKEGMIAVAGDGRIWVAYSNKMTNGQYKVYFRTRTKDTPFSGGRAPSPGKTTEEQAYLAVDPTTNIPWVTYMGNEGTEGSNFVNLVKLDEKNYPRESVIPERLEHYPRLAIDSEGKGHVAVEIGQGDNGTGIIYTNNVDGPWTTPIDLPNSGGGPKLPNIAADPYGNVAVVWDSMIDMVPQAWFTSRYPVEIKHFYAPAGRSVKIGITGTMHDYALTYTLSWAKNPDNNDKFIRGYRIYKKTGAGDYEFVVEVDKTVFSQSFNFTALLGKVQFAISTVSTAGFEGERVSFF
jgi:hypothetical protein